MSITVDGQRKYGGRTLAHLVKRFDQFLLTARQIALVGLCRQHHIDTDDRGACDGQGIEQIGKMPVPQG